MLDFRGMQRSQWSAVMQVLPSEFGDGAHIFFSGRSFHAYWIRLLTHREWIKFMGASLLCNRLRVTVVDTRWVGHRLLGGYGALRWSRNTSQHAHYPTLVVSEVLDLSYADKLAMLSSLALTHSSRAGALRRKSPSPAHQPGTASSGRVGVCKGSSSNNKSQR
jgi:hypothetical protein